MDFLPVATPQTESELAVMVSLLEAHGIQHYVHNQSFGDLYPGMQMDLYNARRVMVPSDRAAEALDLLAVFSHRSASSDAEERMTLTDKLRVVIETFVFGWSFPSKRNRRGRKQDSDDI
jgi:hypothetical protein